MIEPFYVDGQNLTKRTQMSYDKKGNISELKVTRHKLNDSADALIEEDLITIYEYNGLGKCTAKKVKNDSDSFDVYKYNYDAMGNLISEYDPRYSNSLDNSHIAYTYDALNRIETIKVIDNEYTDNNLEGRNYYISAYYVYDERGNVTKKVSGEGYTEKTIIIEGNSVSVPDEHNSKGDKYTYDYADRLKTVTSADLYKKHGANYFSKRYTYDGSGRVIDLEVCGENNADPIRTTTTKYYLNGKIKNFQYPDALQTSYDVSNYDLTGKIKNTNIDRKGNAIITYNNVFNKTYCVYYPDGNCESFEYNSLGQIMVAYDRAQNAAYYEYDDNNNVISEIVKYKDEGEDEYYRQTKRLFDQLGNVLKSQVFEVLNYTPQHTPLPTTAVSSAVYYYSYLNKPVKIQSLGGREIVYAYDEAGNLVAEKQKYDVDKYIVKYYEFDVQSKVRKETLLTNKDDIDLEKFPATPEYDDEYSENQLGDMLKVSTIYFYDKSGNLKEKLGAYGQKTCYTYNLDNKPENMTVYYRNDITSENNIKEYTSSYVYGLNGNLTATKIPRLNESGQVIIAEQYEYNSIGRIHKKITPAADGGLSTTEYEYDLNGNIIKEILPKSIADGSRDVVKIIYDKMNRPIVKIAKEGIVEYIEYDALGRVCKKIDGRNIKFTDLNAVNSSGKLYDYNMQDEKLEIRDIEGQTPYYIDELSSATVYTYNFLNVLTSVSDAMQAVTTFEIDVLGRTTKQTDDKDGKTSYQYYDDGTLWRIDYPIEVSAPAEYLEYTYDLMGRKLTEKNAKGNITKYSYNSFNNIRSIEDANQKVEKYKYDTDGNRTWYMDRNNTEKVSNKAAHHFAYDSYGKVTKQKIPLEYDENGDIIYAITENEYDGAGNLTKQTLTGDKNAAQSRVTEYKYYDNNLVKSANDISNGTYSKSYWIKNYDKNGNLTEYKALRDTGKWDIQKYTYDYLNRVKEEIKLIDSEALLNPSNALLDSESNMYKQIIGYDYDVLGSVVAKKLPLYYCATPEYEDLYKTDYEYDSMGRLIEVRSKTQTFDENADVTTKYWYNSVGNKIIETVTAGGKTLSSVYKYDPMNRLTEIRDTLAIEKSNGINDTNRQSIINGDYSTLPYISTVYAYDEVGNKISESATQDYTDNNVISKTYTYDNLNRLETIVNSDNNVVLKNVYDANGNIVKVYDAKGFAANYYTEYIYDLANRVESVIDPETALHNKKSMVYEYNQYGQKIAQTNAMDESVLYEYNNAGRLNKVIIPVPVSDNQDNEIIVSYDYDNAGNKTSFIDGRGKETTYLYSSFGLLTGILDAENKTESYLYNINANVAKMTDKMSQETTYTYNSSELLLAKTCGDLSVSFDYDAFGNRALMKDKGSSSQSSDISVYTYDSANRLTTISKGGNQQITYSYDALNNITVCETPDSTVSYEYDNKNRLHFVRSSSMTAEYGYDDNYNLNSVTYQETSKTIYNFDKNNRLIHVLNSKLNNAVISQYDYDYDLAGRLNYKKQTIDGAVKIDAYIFDNAGRISDVKIYTSEQDYNTETYEYNAVYTYDNSGNRASVSETYVADQSYTVPGRNNIDYKTKASNYFYSDSNKLLKTVESYKSEAEEELVSKTISCDYDDNGNQLSSQAEWISSPPYEAESSSIAQTSQENMFDEAIELVYNGYDVLNRLISSESIKEGKRITAEFSYDGDNTRIIKTAKNSDNNYVPVTTKYLYDRGYVIAEADGSGNIQASYVRGFGYISKTEGSNSYNYLFNGHGDTVQTIDGSGTVLNSYEYDIFGNLAGQQNEDDTNSILYAGEFFDNETGLYYLRARYYNSYQGRFITQDTYAGQEDDPLSLNRYTYCHNDPINFVDPTGHWDDYYWDYYYDYYYNYYYDYYQNYYYDYYYDGYYGYDNYYDTGYNYYSYTFDSIYNRAFSQIKKENETTEFPNWANVKLMEYKLQYMMSDHYNTSIEPTEDMQSAAYWAGELRDKVDRINLIENDSMREIINNISEKYYDNDYINQRDKIADYGSGFWSKIDEINSLNYQSQKDMLINATLDWYNADGYVYSDKYFAFFPDDGGMQKAKDNANYLREIVRQQNEYFDSIYDWARPIAMKFSQEYDNAYIANNQEDMDVASYWGAQFRDVALKEIVKMTLENQSHGDQLAWYTNMYFTHPNEKDWAGLSQGLKQEHANWLVEQEKAKAVVEMIRPTSGRVTSEFGPRTAPTVGASSNHGGIDLGPPAGTPIVATLGGTVSFAGWQNGYGNIVILNHSDGIQSAYAHMQSADVVSVGQQVIQGTVIGHVGNTGLGTGPHLHFEVRVNGVRVNPRDYVNFD